MNGKNHGTVALIISLFAAGIAAGMFFVFAKNIGGFTAAFKTIFGGYNDTLSIITGQSKS